MFRRSVRQPFPAVLAAAVLTMAAGRPAAAESVNFDNVAASSAGTIFAGNTWSSKGVVFRSVKSQNALLVGQTITVSTGTANLMVLGNADSVSAPNFAAASGVFDGSGRNDVLMHFASPVDSVRLVTDQSKGETPDFVRLLTLVPAGSNKFVVTGIDVGLDNAITSPQNVLAVDPPNPVSWALFQVTTEAEGFDNLVYTHPPTCPNHGPIVGACYQHPPATDWVPVGCEVVDCCPGCPGPLDWQIYVDGDPFRQLVLHFDGLDTDTASKLSVEGGVWNADRQTLEIDGPGTVTIHGFALGADPRWSASSPRISLQSIEAPAATGAPQGAAPRAGAPTHAVRLRVSQTVGEREISQSTLVYGF
jgi:hypothetical protein